MLVLLGAAEAAATEVTIRCQRLGARSDEVVARIRVSLHSADPAARPERVAVRCSTKSAQVVWDRPPKEELAVDESGGLVDGVLDAVDSRLAAAQTARSTQPGAEGRSAATPVSPNELPDLTRPPRETTPSEERRPRRIGGLGLGLVTEPWFETGQWGLGPRLDVGVGIGPVVALATEGFRVGLGGDQSGFVFDVAMGAGLGAPYDPSRTLGAVMTLGLEYFSAIGGGGGPISGTTVVAGTVTLGGRAAMPLARGAVWLGLDGRYRTHELALGDPFDLALSRVTVMLSLGAMLLADP